jgi:hypothetical protein
MEILEIYTPQEAVGDSRVVVAVVGRWWVGGCPGPGVLGWCAAVAGSGGLGLGGRFGVWVAVVAVQCEEVAGGVDEFPFAVHGG